MSELKPCPFCGNKAAEPIFIGNDHTKRRKVTIKCGAPGCTKGVTVGAMRFSHEWCHAEAVKKWNTRTVDDELSAAKAHIAELEKALEPFGELSGQFVHVDDDGCHHAMSDDESMLAVVNAGDARRAAALLNKETP